MTKISSSPTCRGYRPDGCVHTVTTKNGATVLLVLTGGIEPATDRRSAPPSQIFTLSELPWIEARPGVRQKRIWEDNATERRALLHTLRRWKDGANLLVDRSMNMTRDPALSLCPREKRGSRYNLAGSRGSRGSHTARQRVTI